MKTTKNADGALIRFPMAGGGWLTYSTDQLAEMPPERLAALRELIYRPPAAMKTNHLKTGTRRRRKTFADGSHVIVSNSGYEIFEGIPKSQKSKRKAKPAKPAP